MDKQRKRHLAWIEREFLPHEGEVRAWLKRRLRWSEDSSDLIQEAYCRAWAVGDPDRIGNPRAYFFKTVRNILIDQVRRSSVVHIGVIADIESAPGQEDWVSPERILSGRQDLQRVQDLINALPERCRRIMILRKIEGLSQREIASRCGVTESIVENELRRGLQLVLRAFEDETAAAPSLGNKKERTKGRERRSDR